jgi:chromosome segregation ATPase
VLIIPSSQGSQLDGDLHHQHRATSISQLRNRVAELLDEKEQRKGQLKKTQDTLVISEAESSSCKKELRALKEQATGWEVDIARLNVDLARKSSNPLTLSCPT